MVILSCSQKCCNCFQNTKRSYLQHCLLQTTAELRRAQRKHAIIKIIDSLGFLESISIDWHHILCLLVHIPSKSRKMNRLITFFHYKKCWISCFLHTLASVVSLFFCKILCNVAEIFSYFPQFGISTCSVFFLPTCFTTSLVLPTSPIPLLGSLPNSIDILSLCSSNDLSIC